MPPGSPLQLLLLDPLLVPHEDAGERRHHRRGMARAAAKPAPQAAEKDAARALRVKQIQLGIFPSNLTTAEHEHFTIKYNENSNSYL